MNQPETNLFDRFAKRFNNVPVSSTIPSNRVIEESRRRLLAPSTTPNNKSYSTPTFAPRSIGVHDGRPQYQIRPVHLQTRAGIMATGGNSEATRNASSGIESLSSVKPELTPSILQSQANVSSSATEIGQSEQTLAASAILKAHKKTRNLWAEKIHLQVACGINPEENLRVSDVISMGVETIRNLQTEELERTTEIMNLMKQQAHLLDRVAYYKKLYGQK